MKQLIFPGITVSHCGICIFIISIFWCRFSLCACVIIPDKEWSVVRLGDRMVRTLGMF